MYFNLNLKENQKKSSRIDIRSKRLSLNRIIVSKAEMKHVNNKVVITVYLFNKNKQYLIYKLKELYKKFKIRALKTVKLAEKFAPKNMFTRKIVKPTNKLKEISVNNNNSTSKTVFRIFKVERENILIRDPEFSSKRYGLGIKKSQSRGYIPKTRIKYNHYLYYNILTKIDLSSFISRLRENNKKRKNLSPTLAFLKDKYINLIRKYYSLLDNENIKTMKKNYFLNFVNLGKEKVGQVNTYNLNLELINMGKKKGFSIRKTRTLKNFMHKLRNLHKLFFLTEANSKISNSAGITLSKYSTSKLELLPHKSNDFLLENLNKILKKEITVKKVIKSISLTGLRIVNKARKNRIFLLKTLK